jgi:amidohydrolase
MLEHLIQLRHELHRHPEISGNEQQTAARIRNYLLPLQPNELLTEVGGHGVVATFDSGKPGPTLLFRAELDALPIQEINTFEYGSSRAGISHKCGHDGHATILCGLAERLAKNKPTRGKVHLLFQPAEETGTGAAAVLADPKFSSIKPDMGIALHNFPGYKLGSVIVKDSIITIAVQSIVFRFQGRTSHASQPEYGINPTLAVAELLQKSDTFNYNHEESEGVALVTPIFTRVGTPEAYGVTAGDAEVHFTFRAFNHERLERLGKKLIDLATELTGKHHLHLNHEVLQTFHANDNDPAVTNLVRKTGKAQGLELFERLHPLKGGEDFGLFTSRFPCCMFMLGAGESTPALHSPNYDFPDSLIETGTRLFDGIVRKVLA